MVHLLSIFSNRGTLSHNLSPRLRTAVKFQGAGPGAMLTVCQTTPQLHLHLWSNTHFHKFTGPTAPLYWKMNGRDLYG